MGSRAAKIRPAEQNALLKGYQFRAGVSKSPGFSGVARSSPGVPEKRCEPVRLADQAADHGSAQNFKLAHSGESQRGSQLSDAAARIQ